MYSTVRTAVLDGISAIPVQVEVDISTGMPVFDMVGNLTSEVREAKERVKTALHSVGIVLPAKRITVNLSPANIKKTGTGFDLPIAVAILTAMGVIDADSIKDCTLAGELNLNGEILPVSGILPIVFDEYNKGIGKFIIPKQNENEGRLVCGAKIFGISHLNDVIAQFDEAAFTCQKTGMAHELQMDEKYADFCDVNGQKFIKRACEVAAGGMHNILLVGPPGAGKTMIAERMPSILPPLSENERLELSKIYSICGLLDNDSSLRDSRPFRNPHYSVTQAALIGGGTRINPGEISLAHNGVLFLDELAEFKGGLLDLLRAPLEEQCIRLSRAGRNVTYPANFLLFGAMNVFQTVLIQPTIWVHLNRLDKAYKGDILLCDRQTKRGKIFCDDIWLIGQFIFKIVFETLLTILRDNRYNIKGQGISISNVPVFSTNIHFYNLTKGGVL